MEVTVATANILYRLGRDDARTSLRQVLEHDPDLVGLQEWYPTRLGPLLETGAVGPVPGWGGRLARSRIGSGDYLWNAPLVGGCVVGARVDRFELLTCRGRWLSLPGRAEREDRPLGLEPPRPATVAVYRDRQAGGTVALVAYHLVSGVQSRGAYRPDRPRLAARHRGEVRRLRAVVSGLLAAGHVVHAVGDSNWDGLRIPGLTSAWEGREDAPGSLGRRHIDDVHGPGPAQSVTAVRTPSDHRALVVRRSWPLALSRLARA